MLIAVLVLALVGMVLMGAAIITGNTFLSLAVIAIAALGLVLLARDWLRDRRGRAAATGGDSQAGEQHRAAGHETRALEPDMFEPDVSYEDAVAEEHQGAASEKNGE